MFAREMAENRWTGDHKSLAHAPRASERSELHAQRRQAVQCHAMQTRAAQRDMPPRPSTLPPVARQAPPRRLAVVAEVEVEVTEPVKEVKSEDTEAAAEPSAAVAEANAEAIWRRSNGCSSGLASTSNAATSTWNVGEKCIAA